CDRLRIATLSFNARNVAKLAGWLDEKQVGALTLLCSVFHRENSRPDYLAAVHELRQARGVRLAAARNHAKVVTMEWAGGNGLVLTPSDHRKPTPTQDQRPAPNARQVCDGHGGWIDALVTRHERDDDAGTGSAEATPEEGDQSRSDATG